MRNCRVSTGSARHEDGGGFYNFSREEKVEECLFEGDFFGVFVNTVDYYYEKSVPVSTRCLDRSERHLASFGMDRHSQV